MASKNPLQIAPFFVADLAGGSLCGREREGARLPSLKRRGGKKFEPVVATLGE